MALHDALRDLVMARGPAVVDDGEEFRAALDDFLAEDEASLGEINLLVDAVRLGAFARLRELLRQGGDPRAAVDEAAVQLARDRGTDDPGRSRWALAALGYGIGAFDADFVAACSPAARPTSAPAPAPPDPPRVGTDALPSTSPMPEPEPEPEPSGGGSALPPPPPPPPPQWQRVPPVVPPEPGPRRRGAVLLAVAAVLLLVVGVGAGWWWLNRDGDGTATDRGGPSAETSDPSSEPTSEATTEPTVEPLVGEDTLLVAFSGGAGNAVDEVDPGTGERDRLTGAAGLVLPNISHDRTMVVVMAGKPDLREARALVDGSPVPVFDEAGPCRYSARPSWSPDDTRVAVICMGADTVPTGVYVADVGDTLPLMPRRVVADPLVYGTPTWLPGGRIVFSRYADEAHSSSAMAVVPAGGGTAAAFGDPIAGFITHTTYSREAKRLLAVHSTADDDHYGELWLYGADGGSGERIGADGGPYASPVWSPDGTMIAFNLQEDGQPRVAVAPVDDPAAASLVPQQGLGRPGVVAWGSR
ncbi:hypothetical protein [Nocardioides sp. YIM 152588]|uniref:hypothetical protein n=1 Tax=Nocardioides sp. YIM 152588 TaxID=3158259 RepID=UPI0032E492A1